MLDLNDVCARPPAGFDLDEIRHRLQATAPFWVPSLFPNGRMSFDRKTLRCANLYGDPPRKEGSVSIELTGPYAGWGSDYATNETVGPIDLIGYATGKTGRDLFEEAARIAGMPFPAVETKPQQKKDRSNKISFVLDHCKPSPGTLVDVYLASRGLKNPGCADLLFHADLTHFEERRGFPAMVAIARDASGAPTGGIHRTYLRDDGAGKAEIAKAKSMLGPVAGGAVRLFEIGPDGHVGIAEGIETALSAQKIFGVPTWAALSAGGMKDWSAPEGVREVTIFADAGKPDRNGIVPGLAAAAGLADRLARDGIAARIVTPLHGDDFNDDLQKGATAADYARVTTQARANPPRGFEELHAAAMAMTFPPDVQTLSRLLEAISAAGLEPVPLRHVLAAIKAATRIPVLVLEKQLKDMRRKIAGAGPAAVPRPAWAGMLRVSDDGTPERNEANVITALSNDEAFAGALIFDEFRQEIMVSRTLPWDSGLEDRRSWIDNDDVRAAEWLQRRDINVQPAVVSRAVGAVARDVTEHPCASTSPAFNGTDSRALMPLP
jgi:phage/plasmid primase-like uncharacterized protein